MNDIEARRREAETPLTDEEKKMVADFEGYLSPLIRCGYTHAIIQLREWAGEFSPVIPSSLLSKLEEMEENKQEVDKALLSKEMEAYTKDRALLASQLSTARQQLEEKDREIESLQSTIHELTTPDDINEANALHGNQRIIEYLRRLGAGEYRLVVLGNESGYIHALGRDSETLDISIKLIDP